MPCLYIKSYKVKLCYKEIIIHFKLYFNNPDSES